jgi:Tol biopolymer transport system component
MMWFDRTGKKAGAVGISGSYSNVRLSPDGRRIAEDQPGPDGRNNAIWIHEPARGTIARLTFDPSAHQTPVWSPDGKQILYSANRISANRRHMGNQLYLKNADGSSTEEEVTDLDAVQLNAWDWSRDGKYVLFRRGNELWYLSWPERAPKPLLQAKWTVQNAQFSPDGRWMAYASPWRAPASKLICQSRCFRLTGASRFHRWTSSPTM